MSVTSPTVRERLDFLWCRLMRETDSRRQHWRLHLDRDSHRELMSDCTAARLDLVLTDGGMRWRGLPTTVHSLLELGAFADAQEDVSLAATTPPEPVVISIEYRLPRSGRTAYLDDPGCDPAWTEGELPRRELL